MRLGALVTAAACLVLAAAGGAQQAVETPAPAGSAATAAATASVPVSVLAVAFPIPDSADAQVPLIVEVGGPQLLAGHGEGVLEGDIRAVAIDAAGRAIQQLVQPFTLSGSDETLQRTGLKLYAVMRLPTGDYRLKVTATNAKTGAMGSWEGSLRVPDFTTGGVAMTPPLFPDSPDRWRVFQQSDSTHEALGYPFLGAGGEAFLPAAAPRVGLDGSPFHLYLYGAEGIPQRFEARLLGPGGQETRVPLEVVGMAAGATPGSRKVTLRLGGSLPPPGGYRLELAVGGAWGVASTGSAVALVPERIAAPQALAVVTRSVGGEADAGYVPEPEVEEPVVPARDWTPEALAKRYRELLVRGADEGFEAVARELAETELSATADHKRGQAKALRQVQDGVLERLEAGGRDALVPVIYLHYLEDLELARRGEMWMLAQNRHWITVLVQRWAGRDAAARRTGAQLLATVGLSPVALELDPTNDLALLRQAMSSEKFGKLDDAAEWLDQLLAAHPANHHARLRRGVVLRRLGRAAEAAPVLASLAQDEDVPRWIAVLATQELAEVQRHAGQRAAAEATLRKGIERLGAQELFVQLSFYLDEWQRPDESVGVLNRMPPHSDESSARHLYNAPPEAELAAARREFEAVLPDALPQLQVALGNLAAAEVAR